MEFETIPEDDSLADPLPSTPLLLLDRWLTEARSRSEQLNPDAMALATVGSDGQPSCRMVLYRGFDHAQGFVVFYTNLTSRKSLELQQNPRAAGVFYWDALRRQVRIEGPITPSPGAESDAYFATRARSSQIAAWASKQSQPLASREALLKQLTEREQEFADQVVMRPPFWGGYRLFMERVEFWVGSQGRAHDRVLWARTLDLDTATHSVSKWTVCRLQP